MVTASTDGDQRRGDEREGKWEEEQGRAELTRSSLEGSRKAGEAGDDGDAHGMVAAGSEEEVDADGDWRLPARFLRLG